MSGYKRATVTIGEEEYRRLHEADMKRRFKEHSKEDKTPGQMAELTHTLRDVESRQEALERALNYLDADFDWMGAELVQDILTQNARCYQTLTTIIEETASESNASLALLSQRFTEEMQKEREHYRDHLQSLFQRFDTYEQREQSKAEAARQWLRQSAALADFIQKQFDHERFLPGKFSRIFSNLHLGQDNLAQGFYESSLQTSQQAFLGLSDLRMELEQRTVEWQTEYAGARNALTQFIAELERNSSVNAFGLEGEELPAQVDLAYWSNGKYGELLDKSRQLLNLLSEDRQSIPTQELKRTHRELLPILVDRFESIIYDARLNALNSQLRMNIAERALQALENQGFKLNEAGYTHQDMRAAFMASLDNPDGSRVTIEVLPAEKSKQELSNELVVTTNHPYLKTEHEARLLWQELCHSLHQYDLHVSRPEIHAVPPHTTTEYVEPSSRLSKALVHSERHRNV